MAPIGIAERSCHGRGAVREQRQEAKPGLLGGSVRVDGRAEFGPIAVRHAIIKEVIVTD
jgi:hypothetical protein